MTPSELTPNASKVTTAPAGLVASATTTSDSTSAGGSELTGRSMMSSVPGPICRTAPLVSVASTVTVYLPAVPSTSSGTQTYSDVALAKVGTTMKSPASPEI